MNRNELLEDLESLNVLLKKNDCLLYGAGKMGHAVVQYASRNHWQIRSMVVSCLNGNPSDIMGVSVLTVSELDKFLAGDDVTVIVCTQERLHQEIREKLVKFSSLRVYYLSDYLGSTLCFKLADSGWGNFDLIHKLLRRQESLEFTMRNIWNGMLRTMPQPRLQYFILNICNHCNLNCKGCNHFSNLAEPYFVPVATIEKDLEQMYLVHGDVPRIGIMGGEPLLHPALADILRISRRIFKKSELLLSTNGILCKKMNNELWRVLKSNDITLRFTRYPIGVNYDALVKDAEDKGVKVDYFFGGETVRRFNSLAMEPSGNQNPMASFMSCGFANQCVLLMEGKLYTCQVIPNIKFFAKEFGMDFPVEEKDYIDIYKSNREKVLESLARPVPFCRFCNVWKRDFCSYEWGVSKREKEEWL